MQFERQGQRVALRAGLLLGAAGAAAAVSSAALADQTPTQPPADPQKWSPYSSIEGSAGSGMVAGKLDFFVPVFQNLDSLVFLNLGVGTETKAHMLFNAGVGYRTEIDSDWIVGAYVNHDSTQLPDNNTLDQTTFGAELMSADWDLRLNGYLADNKPAPIPGEYGLYINGTTIGILQGQDVGYSGVDGEVGYRVWSDDTTDVRVFIGAFHFSHDNTNTMSMGQGFGFGYRDLTGPKARAEATVYDLDVLGNQSRVSLDGEIAHDDVRGTTGFVGATLRIALGNFSGGGGAQALDELDRRMVDPERRNDTVTTRSQMTKPEPVIIYGPGVKSQPTNTLLYVDNTLGAGTYANPTTFADAAARNTSNAFIVLTSKQGPIAGGATLQAGQTVVAGGETLTVEGEFSHTKFTHLFDPSTNVTVVPATPGANVITLASNTSLYGFTIKGAFGDAIYGKNVDNVNISHVTIDGTGGGQNGIVINHTVSGEENVTIQNVAISNLTEDGIDLTSNIADGGTSTETFKLNNISVSNVGADGIAISDYAGKGTTITSDITLSNVSVTSSGAYSSGISIYATAYGAGSAVNQTLAISNATVAAPYSGISVFSIAGYGGHVTSSVSITGASVSGSGIAVGADAYGAGSTNNQTLTLSNATVTSPSYTGVVLRADASGGASVTETDTLSGVTVTGATTHGVSVYALGGGTGTQIDQTVSLSNATISNTGRDGVYVRTEAGYGATVYQTIAFSNVAITNAGANGFEIATAAEQGGQVVQSATISNSSATYSYRDGLLIEAAALDTGSSTPATVDQYVSVSGSNFSHDYAGIYIVNRAAPFSSGISSAADTQTVSISNTTIDDNAVGVVMENQALYGASANQYVTLSGVQIEHNYYVGVAALSEAAVLGFAKQFVTIDNPSGYNEISYNGVGIETLALAADGGAIDQHLYVYHSHVDHNTGDGISVATSNAGYAVENGQIYYSHIQQNLTFAYGTISNNGGDGVHIENTVNYVAQTDQVIQLYRETVDHNAGNGFYEGSVMTTDRGAGFAGNTVLHSDVYLQNSDFSYNGASGINIQSKLNSPSTYIPKYVAYSYLEQHITVAYVTANHNAQNGFTNAAYDKGVFGLNIQYVTLQASQFTYNNDHGAELIAHQVYGPGGFGAAEQIVTLSGSQFSRNTGNGLYAYAYAGGNQGRAEQHFTVTGSYFDNNGANGIYLLHEAKNGVLVPGIPCYAVQGLPGGCAFVRQTFAMYGGGASNNHIDGFYIRNYAGNLGAIYGTAGHAQGPTVLLDGAQFNNNGNDGFYSHTKVYNGSFAYNFIVAIDTTFNNNGRDGFHTNSYAGAGTQFSVIVERNLLYSYKTGTQANGNGHDGINIYVDAVGGSYLFSSNSTFSKYGPGVTTSGNKYDGIAIGAANFFFVHGYGYVSQSNALYGNTVTNNGGDGIALFAGGPGVGTTHYTLGVGTTYYNQTTKLVGNTVTSNTRYGLYAESIFGAVQVVNVYTGNNTITSNTAGNYHFTPAFGGHQYVR